MITVTMLFSIVKIGIVHSSEYIVNILISTNITLHKYFNTYKWDLMFCLRMLQNTISSDNNTTKPKPIVTAI